MRINNNIMALNAHRQLAINQSNASKSMEKLSSGFRINRAADDAAGLSISEKMRSQIRGLKQAARNAQDGISLIQTAEGALNETHAILQRMRKLVVQAGSVGTNQPEDLTAIQDEINELIAEINGISERTAFNGKTLLDGSLTGDGVLTFQIGANQKQAMTLEIGDMSASGLGLGGAETLTQVEEAFDGVENQIVLKNAAGDVVAVQVGDDWYAPEDVVANDDGDGLELVVVTPETLDIAEGFSIDGEGFLTQEKEAYAGVEDQTVLKNAAGDVVAVQVEGDWYAPEDVVANDGEDDLELVDDAEILDITEGFSIDGEGFLTQENEEFAGVEDQTVLKNADGDVVAVQVGGDWYAPEDVVANDDGDDLELVVVTPETLDIAEGFSINVAEFKTSDDFDKAVGFIDTAIGLVSSQRSKLGANQNRLEHTISNLNNAQENLQAAESRIRDLDMAEEIMAFTKNNILQQAATAMLAQANMAPQSVLQLLG